MCRAVHDATVKTLGAACPKAGIIGIEGNGWHCMGSVLCNQKLGIYSKNAEAFGATGKRKAWNI